MGAFMFVPFGLVVAGLVYLQYRVLDGKMMQWLIAARSVERVEIVGPWILVATKRIDPRYWLELGTWLDSFRTHIPPVLYKTYPPGEIT